jgi:hypothetical protein
VWDGRVAGAPDAAPQSVGHAATSLENAVPLPAAFGLFANTTLVEAEAAKLDSRIYLHRADSARNVLRHLPQPARRPAAGGGAAAAPPRGKLVAQSSLTAGPQSATRGGASRHKPPHGSLVDSIRSSLVLQGLLYDAPPSIATHDVSAAPAAPNAFAISLFCVHPEYESRFADFLAAAFRALPHVDYAILSQPHTAPDMQLLRRFEQVQPRLRSTLPQVLHVCHRSAAVSPGLVSCRFATPIDRLPILELVAPLPDGAAFMDAVIAAERFAAAAAPGPSAPPPPLVSVVAELGGALIGAFVLSTAGSTALAWEAVTHSFDLDSFVAPRLFLEREPAAHPPSPAAGASQRSGSASPAAGRAGTPAPGAAFATLLHAAIDPSAECAAPRALLAALRLLPGARALVFRQLPPPDGGPHVAAPLPGVVLRHMALVPPRRLPALSPAQQRARSEQRSESDTLWSSLAIAGGGGATDEVAALQVRARPPTARTRARVLRPPLPPRPSPILRPDRARPSLWV